MPIEKVEYEFPEPEEADGLQIEVPQNRMDPFGKEDKEVEVEVVDDTPPADRNKQPSTPPDEVTEEELQAYSDKVQKRIKHFSKGYHDQRRAAEQAQRDKAALEQYTAKLIEENKQLKGTVSENQKAMLEHVKKMAASEFEEAKLKLKRAYDAGDSNGLVSAQEEMTAAKLKIEKVGNIRLQPPLQEPSPAVQSSPSPAPDTRAVEWQRSNPWFGQDDEMTSLALGLHQKLVKQGIDPASQSDEYYQQIDTRMRELFPDRFSNGEERPKSHRTVVAPATRSTAPKKITLTKTQVALAKRLGVPLAEYAKQVAIEMRSQNG